MKTVLVVAAHSDDEVLGCGATIAKHVTEGDQVHLLVLTNGVSARKGANDTDIASRELALSNAAKTLGIHKVVQCDFPDNQLDSVALLDIVQCIENKTQGLSPDIIYTHNASDLNIDHQLTCRAVQTAFRPQPDCSVKTILTFEVLSSTEWQFVEQNFSANWFVDVSGFIEQKITAMQCYQDELRAFPHPRSVEGIKILANYHGMRIGVSYAEAFQVLRHLT